MFINVLVLVTTLFSPTTDAGNLTIEQVQPMIATTTSIAGGDWEYSLTA